MKKAAVFLSFLFLLTSFTHAANRFIPFQARLTDGDGIVLNGVFKLIFIVYDEPTGGTAMWTEEHQDVSVLNGMVNVILGTKTDLDDPAGDGSNNSVYFTNNRYLGITVGTNSNQEMVPRHQIVPSFQSRIADRAFLADRATEADNADMLNNQLPAFYATKTSVDDVSSDLNQKIVDANSLVFDNATAIRQAVPAGTIMAYMSKDGTVPAGYLLADGRPVAVAEYPDLFAAIGTMFGSSVDHFNLPDLRGYFLRGWDSGRGIDSGRSLGSSQADAFQGHGHDYYVGHTGSSHHHYNSHNQLANASDLGGRSLKSSSGGSQNIINKPTVYNSYGTPRIASETRPKNTAVMYIIKY